MKINSCDIQGHFIVPPECAGQIVIYSYACTHEYILEKSFDGSTGKSTIIAYDWGKEEEFTPWNGVPDVGKKIGKIEII